MQFQCYPDSREDYFFEDVQVMVDPLVARMAGSSITNKHGVEPMQKVIAVDTTTNGERKTHKE